MELRYASWKRFYPTWLSGTRPSMGIQTSGVGDSVVICVQ